jgi:hypothetical protein
MSRKLVSFILIAFVIAAMFSIARVATLIEGHVIEDTPLEAKDIKVGAYYYLWYTGNWTRDHHNCVDTPVLGPYNSSEPSLIQKHLDWFEELRIDFLIVSWWGINSLTNNNTKILFSEVEVDPVVELAIMVEPFNESYGQSGYNFTEMYDYIYDNYASSNVYMNLNDRPLLCIFNAENLTKNGMVPLDERFEIRLVGSKFNKYNNWEYEVPCISDTEPPDVVDYANQHLCVDGEIMVCPRYHAHGWERDLTLAEGLYDKQWGRAINLAREGKVNIVMIISWNEFPERTFTEPAVDSTSYSEDPYLLFKKTREYINILKGVFTFFVKEILETVGDLGENQCRYNVKDDQGCRLDTIKIIENPEGGYLGMYHSNVSKILQVRLANSTDLLRWTFIRTIDQEAAQPTIAKAPNNAYIVAFEKEDANNTRLRFQYYSNLSSLIIGPPDATYDANRTLSSSHEGTPNVYNVTIEGSTLSACISFHYDDGSVDNAAVGWLTIPLDNPQNMVWNNTQPLTRYNQDLRDKYQVKGNIGDRDYGQIFGRNFTLQEGNLEERSPDTNWTAWRIFLYDHSTRSFTKLSITTHFNATSFGNPTFTFLRSPNNKPCIVITYFLFGEGLSDEYKDKAGELIFYKEFKTEPFPITHDNKPHSINVTSNSTISSFDFSEPERSISFNVSGLDNSEGFCVIEIPKELVQNLWQNNYTVLLKGKQWPFENWTCTENTYIYINYIHSTHKVIITPEFPSFLILPLFMMATLLAVAVYKRKHSM